MQSYPDSVLTEVLVVVALARSRMICAIAWPTEDTVDAEVHQPRQAEAEQGAGKDEPWYPRRQSVLVSQGIASSHNTKLYALENPRGLYIF